MTENNELPYPVNDLSAASDAAFQALLDHADRDGISRGELAVEVLAERWESEGEQRLLDSRAPGTNIGQQFSSMEFAAERRSYAEAVRAALGVQS